MKEPSWPEQNERGEELILRDFLALDRTALANERTLLAWVRTALAFFIAGATFIKFFDTTVMTVTGWIFIPAGAVLLLLGLRSFRNTRRRVEREVRTSRVS